MYKNTDKVYWNNVVSRANFIRKTLDEKPLELKIGHWSEPGSILNAYREGDLTFDEAYYELKELIEGNSNIYWKERK